MAEKAVSSDFEITMTKDRRQFLHNAIEKDSVKTVGFEGNSVSYSKFKAYSEEYKEVSFIDIGDTIEVIRQIKTPEEIQFIQKAQDITDAAFSHVLGMLTPEMTELEVAAELEYAMRRGGAEGISFDTIAVSGDASSLPHGTPRDCKLKRGFLTMDFGAKYKGYCADMTRTVVIGLADGEMKKLYNTVLEAQKAALDFIRAGVDAAEADSVARDIIDAFPEFKGTFGHSLGHSIGLFVHETPGLSQRYKGKVLRRGEIFSCEPGIYLFGKYGCRIEDLVAVEDNGAYNFTHSAKELIEI
jgi:Xaa-Pro aminopeptidase